MAGESICRCGHTLGFHGFPDDDSGVVLRYRGEPCAWGHVWPTLDEPRCGCVGFEGVA
jgi:hypothetical protein